uniref:Uncharacterized protein n=1 Tax=Timema cristinae TaxID=61476 RepID=A0A7R9H508_TIMCR|nr:unnamed protein product [Timema cristinae]
MHGFRCTHGIGTSLDWSGSVVVFKNTYLEQNNATSWTLEGGYDSNVTFEKSYPHRVSGAGSKKGLVIVLKTNIMDMDFACRWPVKGQHLSHTRYTAMTRDTQTPIRTLDTQVHTLDTPVHTLDTQVHTLDTPVHKLDTQTCLRPPPRTPLAPLIPQSSENVAAHLLDKEGDRENKERSQGGVSDRDLNLNIAVIGSQVYCEESTLD